MHAAWIMPFLIVVWAIIQIGGFILLVWLGWRFFDQRYKGGAHVKTTAWLSGDLERTSEVYIDPRDGHTYRVYYNRLTGEREYVKENE